MDLDAQLRESLGRDYTIERELGPGGMARVFVASEVALGRRVVIKVLPPEMASVVLSERFRREISLAAQLRHPHIIPVLTAGGTNELLYYTMPFVEGETLRARLDRNDAIPLRGGIRMVREIADALAYAHSHGVVHRDIKPDNILIENGHAVVADFGVAKALASATGTEPASGPVTAAGVVMGTAAYMSPEQAAADPATDHRADIYALGVVAYEIFSGALPFKGSSYQMIVAHMVEQPQPLQVRCPQLPPALAELVMQLLAKNPDDRPQSAADVAARLDGVFASLEGVPATTGSQQILNSGLAPGVPRSQAMPRLRRAAVAAGALVVLALGYAGYKLSHTVKGTSSASEPAGAAAALQANSIAVLPFVNTSGDEENKHFSDGLTDELISALGQVRGLKVAARTSVFALSGKGLGARAIADTLGVAKVIDGSARRAGKRLKVTAELVNAADNTVLWSQTFDREMVDVFAVQEEIARAIVGALNVRLTEDEGARLGNRPTTDLEAYDLYLKGRFSWTKRTREGMEAALTYFQSAVERDPKFALSYAGISDVYVAMSNFNYIPTSQALASAQIAADRALEIDSSLTEARASKGYVLASRGDYQESENEFRRAIQLNPSYPSAHHFYTLLLMIEGRLDDATTQNRLTVSLDPLSVSGNATRGIILCERGSYADARRELGKALPLGSGNILAPFYLGTLEAASGHYAEALSYLDRAVVIAPGFHGLKAALAYTYSHVGRRAESDDILKKLRDAASDDRGRVDLALTEAVMGDMNRAYTILAKPAKWDMPTLIELRTDPLLAGFRADRRYPKLLATIGLPN